eukprot:12394021-Ditylum_brightwellii.AAC.2
MIDLASSGLRRSTQIKKTPQQYGFFTLLLGALAVMWTQDTQVFITLQNRASYHAEIAHSLCDKTINNFSPIAFAAKQQQNETYLFNDMMKQNNRKDFIMAYLMKSKFMRIGNTGLS